MIATLHGTTKARSKHVDEKLKFNLKYSTSCWKRDKLKFWIVNCKNYFPNKKVNLNIKNQHKIVFVKKFTKTKNISISANKQKPKIKNKKTEKKHRKSLGCMAQYHSHLRKIYHQTETESLGPKWTDTLNHPLETKISSHPVFHQPTLPLPII